MNVSITRTGFYGFDFSSAHLGRACQTIQPTSSSKEMSGEKRPASAAAFGTTQLVKRQKSDANLNGGAIARVNGAGGGALIQGVSSFVLEAFYTLLRAKAMFSRSGS